MELDGLTKQGTMPFCPNFKQRKKSSLPMTALFQKEKVFLIGITDLPQCENIGEFSHRYYNMWDKKCLAKIN